MIIFTLEKFPWTSWIYSIGSAFKDYVKAITLLGMLTFIIARMLIHALLLQKAPHACVPSLRLAQYFYPNVSSLDIKQFLDPCVSCLNLDQCLLILIWIGAYLVYKIDKNKSELIEVFKNKTKCYIITSYLIHIIFVKIIFICIIGILYLILDESTFLSAIPYLSLSIIGPLFGLSGIIDHPTVHPAVCSIMDSDREVVQKLPQIWELNGNKLEATPENSRKSFLNYMEFRDNINDMTRANQLPDKRPKWITIPMDEAGFGVWLNQMRHACEYLFSAAANDFSVIERDRDIFNIFVLSDGKEAFVKSLHNTRIHAVASLSVFSMQCQYLNMCVLTTYPCIPEAQLYGQDYTMDMLKREDKAQHDFLQTAILGFNLEKKISIHPNAKPSVIIPALIEHMHNLEERSVKGEVVYHTYLSKMQEKYGENLTAMASDVSKHKAKGHLPLWLD